MKRFALAIALTCVLSGSVLAGDAHTVGAPAPAAPPAPGDMGGGGRTDGDQTNGGRTDDDGDQGAGGLALLILDLFF